MTHNHIFHRIGDVSKYPEGSTAESLRASLPRPVPGVEVVCVECGEVRRAYADGIVSVVVEAKSDHGSGA